MKDKLSQLVNSGEARVIIAVGTIAGAVAGLAGTAKAAYSTTLSAATGQVTSYFTTNLGLAIAAFITVCGVLWILSLIFRSVGLHRRRSVG